MIKITIEQIEEVMTPQKKWLLQSEGGKYDYVETDLPQTLTTLLLQQMLMDVDMPSVIKAINKL